jgi:hypothetical protein
MLAFSILLMTAETIGGKTTLLAKFAVILLTMYRPWPVRRAEEPASGSGHRPDWQEGTDGHEGTGPATASLAGAEIL